MDRQFTSRCSVRLAACGALLSGFAAAALPAWAERAPAGQVTVAVFAGHYVLTGSQFDDLNRLEAQVAAARPSMIRLELCGPSTNRALLGAMHRFRHLPLHLRVADESERACASAARIAVRADARPEQRPFGIDDAAVARYWEEDLAP